MKNIPRYLVVISMAIGLLFVLSACGQTAEQSYDMQYQALTPNPQESEKPDSNKPSDEAEDGQIPEEPPLIIVEDDFDFAEDKPVSSETKPVESDSLNADFKEEDTENTESEETTQTNIPNSESEISEVPEISDNNNDIETSVSPSPVSSPSYISTGFPLYNYKWLSHDYLGRLRIPAVGVDVGIYNSSSQSVVDAADCACFYYKQAPNKEGVYTNTTIIVADHNNQGFYKIGNCSIGTQLYIDSTDGNIYTYVCDRVDYHGYNDDINLYDSNGNDVTSIGGIWCYSCNSTSSSITMVHFSAG